MIIIGEQLHTEAQKLIKFLCALCTLILLCEKKNLKSKISVARDYRFCYTIIEWRSYTVPKLKMPLRKLKGNRTYKSSVFASYFSETNQRLIDLYNAFSTVKYPADTPLKINTLKNVLFYTLINDISFVLNNMLIVLIEHQRCARKQPEGCAA